MLPAAHREREAAAQRREDLFGCPPVWAGVLDEAGVCEGGGVGFVQLDALSTRAREGDAEAVGGGGVVGVEGGVDVMGDLWGGGVSGMWTEGGGVRGVVGRGQGNGGG